MQKVVLFYQTGGYRGVPKIKKEWQIVISSLFVRGFLKESGSGFFLSIKE
jgi:hypothetical protein